jgi:hypothetical protein
MRLLGAIELFGLGVFRFAMDESGLQSLGNEPLSHPRDRRAADLQSVGDLGVGQSFAGSILALVGLQEDARMGQLSRRGVSASDHALQGGAVVLGQDYGVLSLPGHVLRGLLLFVAHLRLLKRASAGTIPEKEYCCKPIMSVH